MSALCSTRSEASAICIKKFSGSKFSSLVVLTKVCSPRVSSHSKEAWAAQVTQRSGSALKSIGSTLRVALDSGAAGYTFNVDLGSGASGSKLDVPPESRRAEHPTETLGCPCD